MNPDSTTLWDALVDAARRFPDRPALIGAERALSWGALRDEVERVAGLCWALGVRPGDAVGLCLSKRPEVVVAFLALARLGAIAAPVNFKLEIGHLVDQFQVADLRAVFLEARFDDVIAPVAAQVAGRCVYVGLRGRYAGADWAAIEAAPACPAPPPAPRDPVYYNYTSGTTGRPKGAIHTHAEVLWNARSGVESLGFGPDDVFLGMFSVFAHPHELFHRALLTGAACVVVDTLSPRVVCDLIDAHGVTWMMAVPSFYEMMLDQLPEGRGGRLRSLRVLESGGAWVSADTLHRMEAAFGASFMPVWGSTETCGVVLALLPGGPRVPGTTGRVVFPYEIAVRDDHGRDVAAGETGELLVRGPAVSRGYVGMPDETAAAFRDGWYHTGDLVTRDAEGNCSFVGRHHDMLKVGGIRVFPLEIERVLLAHPAVAEAVVVRAEERVRGEVPRAIVRLRSGVPADPSALRAFCRDHLALYKVPRLLEIWSDLPRLPNGKIDRQAIASSPPHA